MSALEGLRRQITVLEDNVASLTLQFNALRDRVIAQDIQPSSGRTAATSPSTVTKATTHPASTTVKSTVTAPAPTSAPTNVQKSATGKS